MSKVFGRKKRRSKKTEDCWKDCPYVEDTEYPSEKKIFVGFNSNALVPARPIGAPPVQIPVPPNMKYEVIDLLSDDSGDTVIMKYNDEENINTEETVSNNMQAQHLQDLCGVLSDVCALGQASGTSTSPVKCENEIFSLKHIIKDEPSETESDGSGNTVILNSRNCVKHLEENCIPPNTKVKNNTEILEYNVSNDSTLMDSNLISEKENMPLETKTQSTSGQIQIQPLLLSCNHCIKAEYRSDSLPSTTSDVIYAVEIDPTRTNYSLLENSNSSLHSKKDCMPFEIKNQSTSEQNQIQPLSLNYSQCIKTEPQLDTLPSSNSTSIFTPSINVDNPIYSILDNNYMKSDSNLLPDNESKAAYLHGSSNVFAVVEIEPIKNSELFIKREILDNSVCNILDSNYLKSVSNLLSDKEAKHSYLNTSSEVLTAVEPDPIENNELFIKTERLSVTSGITELSQLEKGGCSCSQVMDDVTGTKCNVAENNNPISVSVTLQHNPSTIYSGHLSSETQSLKQSQFIKTEPPTASTINKSLSYGKLDYSYSLPNINVIKDIKTVYCTTGNNISNLPTVIENEPKCSKNSKIFIKTEAPISNLLSSKQHQIGNKNTSSNVLVEKQNQPTSSDVLIVKQGQPQFMEHSYISNETEFPTKDVETGYKNPNTLMSNLNVLSVKRTRLSNQQTQSNMGIAKKIKLQPFEYGRMIIKTEPVSEVESTTLNNSCIKFPVTLGESSSSVDSTVAKQVEFFSVPLNSVKSGNDSSNDHSQIKVLSLQNISTNLNKSSTHFPTRTRIESLDKGTELSLHIEPVYTSSFAKSSDEHLKINKSSSIKSLPVPELAPKVHTFNLEPMQDPNVEFSKASAKFLTLDINFDENDIKDTINYITENHLRRKGNLINFQKYTDQPINYGNISSLPMDKKTGSSSSGLTTEELKTILENASLVFTSNSSDDSVQMDRFSKPDESSKRQIVENDVSTIENIKYKKLKHEYHC